MQEAENESDRVHRAKILELAKDMQYDDDYEESRVTAKQDK
jgi:hypothetical protein